MRSVGSYVTAGSHTCEAALCAESCVGDSVTHESPVPRPPFSLCSLECGRWESVVKPSSLTSAGFLHQRAKQSFLQFPK